MSPAPTSTERAGVTRPLDLVPVVTSTEAASLDRVTIERGTPSRALMQRAGAATAAEIALRCRDRLRAGALVLAGPGNNGGDAWVVARALATSGVAVSVCEPVPAATDEARAERELALQNVKLVPPASAFSGEGIVVDGLLGTGSSGAPREPLAELLSRIAPARERGSVVAAIDIPTGVDATSGAVHGRAFADITFTFGSVKRGHLFARGACGRIVVLDIGLRIEPDAALPRIVGSSWVARQLPGFAADAHKGTRRKVAIVGGGPGMGGAAILAARAALRSGVGMVKLVTAGETLASVREAEPQSLTAKWPENDEEARGMFDGWADVVAIGPGLGGGAAPRTLVERVLRAFRGPVVLDADALNAFNADVNALAKLIQGRPAILTPHPAEFARLTGTAVDDVNARRFDIAGALSRHSRAVVLLKGQPTVVTAPGGERLVSASGTPLLAAAGSGDLLTGMVATLLAQVTDPLVAAACAAWVHGRAARLVQQRARGTAAGGRSGIRGFSLDDVLARLPDAWSLSDLPTRYPVILELPAIV